MPSYPVTGRSLEPLFQYALCHLSGGDVSLATPSLPATHISPRRFDAFVSCAIVPLEMSHVYRCILAAAATLNQTLYQDQAGKLSPTGGGKQVGRAAAVGSVGHIVDFIYDPALTSFQQAAAVTVFRTEYLCTTDVPAGTTLNVNAATPGYTEMQDPLTGFTSHSLGDSPEDFRASYWAIPGVKIYEAGSPVQQNKLAWVSPTSFSLTVPIQQGTELVIETHN